MWEGKRVDDGFFELFDYRVETANVYRSTSVHVQIHSFYHEKASRSIWEIVTVERHRNLLWRDNLHGNRLLVRCQVQVFYTRPVTSPSPLVVLVTIAIVAIACFVREYGAELAVRG